ncbi:acetyl-CoA synthetase-like protein [Ganoderma leucocontextum]|nr:acetyl-CoA synthetase-like protein [Ganoderma leucocontextum]
MPLLSTQVPKNVTIDFRVPKELVERKDVSVSQLYQWHAVENPNYPLFVYYDGGKLEYITYAAADAAMDRVARYVLRSVALDHRSSAAKPPVVAILANADTITYFCTIVGILRSGCTAFLISTRNTSAAVADMLSRTGATHLLVSPDAVMGGIADEAFQSLADLRVHVDRLAMPVFEDLFPETVDPASPFEAEVELPTSYDMEAVAVILHSSGSTAHPKPIDWTHARIFDWGKEPLRSDNDTKGAIMGWHGIPMFHGMGSFMCWAAPMNGLVVAAFKPAAPPTVPTPDAVWEGLASTDVDFSFTVPSFIEQWARDPEKVLVMKKRRGAFFGGAMLNEEIGNLLAAQGVSLFNVYGCTEAGFINTFAKLDSPTDWMYWSISPGHRACFRPMEDGTYEVVMLSPPELPLPRTNTMVDGQDAYATSDIAIPHPTKPGLWKIVGRADEQIVLSNGEKTNPVPLEQIINEDPRVRASLMFGRGKFQNGVLVEPAAFALDPSDMAQVEAFRNKIWPTIERVNAYAPQHSRIFKEMILIASPSKPFQFNAKAIPRRGVILQQYSEEIEAIYRAVENSAQSDFAPPAAWDTTSTLDFVRAIVKSTLSRSLADDADIFRNGGDSLQATWIRNTILRALRETEQDAAKRLPMNLVFQLPSIASLAHAVLSVLNSTHHPEVTHTPEDLWKYVERYSANLPARPSDLVERPPGKDVVLITGTTGGFGCDTLEHLLRDENVARVYAFNRKGTGALERQRAQFVARGLDTSLLDTPKFVMVEAVLHEPDFGIEHALREEIRCTVTHIMHNAWKVDFNMAIPSFEPDIQGARNLVDLALGSPYATPPPLIFVSSVGVFANSNIPAPIPETPLDDPASPFGTGYSEAKWVVERVLQHATQRAGLHTVVVRLGQVAGDRIGYWNEREWFPSLVKTALFQKCLPQHEGNITWFPAYEAARAFAEMRYSPEPILHLVHPRPVAWNAIISPIARALDVPLVPYKAWLSTLEQSTGEGATGQVELMKANPALRILAFFKAQGEATAPNREAMGLAYLSTKKAMEVSQSLAELAPLCGDRPKMWLEAWKTSGFI